MNEKSFLLRLSAEQHQIIRELRRKYPGFFDSESHVLRVALLYYYNKKFKHKTDPIDASNIDIESLK